MVIVVNCKFLEQAIQSEVLCGSTAVGFADSATYNPPRYPKCLCLLGYARSYVILA